MSTAKAVTAFSAKPSDAYGANGCGPQPTWHEECQGINSKASIATQPTRPKRRKSSGHCDSPGYQFEAMPQRYREGQSQWAYFDTIKSNAKLCLPVHISPSMRRWRNSKAATEDGSSENASAPSGMNGKCPAPSISGNEMSDTDAFSPLESHCYVREATTEDGLSGWALIDCDGEVELFSENRSDVFFYAKKHYLTVVRLN